MTPQRVLLLLIPAGLMLGSMVFSSGCAAVRAQVGAGIGIGIDGQIPIVAHTGLSFGAFKYAGFDYRRGLRAGRDDGLWECFFSGVLAHGVRYERHIFFRRGEQQTTFEHYCGGLAPTLFDELYGREPHQPYVLALGLHAFLVSIRLGVDFDALDQPLDPRGRNRRHWYVRQKKIGEPHECSGVHGRAGSCGG